MIGGLPPSAERRTGTGYSSEAEVYPERSQTAPGTTRGPLSEPPNPCVHQVERAGLEPATPSLQSWLSQ